MSDHMASYLSSIPTEQAHLKTSGLDTMNGYEIASLMNNADAQVHLAVQAALAPIGEAIEQIAKRLRMGGNLIYIGAGTSGRLGVLDASECPPTFGVPPERVQGIIAGGDSALRHAAEGVEDDAPMGRRDLLNAKITNKDTVVGISASGYAPYCCAALDAAREIGALAIALSCNKDTPLSKHADIAIEVATGSEILMGSTRLKAGTATKMVLNMLSTGAMARTGRIYQNLMVDMSATNFKLKARALRVIQQATGIPHDEAELLLSRAEGQVKTAILMQLAGVNRQQAEWALEEGEGRISKAKEMLQQLRP